MSEFEEAATLWLATPLPRGSTIDVLDEAHADLALYDTWVAESVLPYLQQGVWSPAVPDVLAALDELTRHIYSLRAEGVDEDDIASAYLSYANLLRRVYSGFLESGQPP